MNYYKDELDRIQKLLKETEESYLAKISELNAHLMSLESQLKVSCARGVFFTFSHLSSVDFTLVFKRKLSERYRAARTSWKVPTN